MFLSTLTGSSMFAAVFTDSAKLCVNAVHGGFTV